MRIFALLLSALVFSTGALVANAFVTYELSSGRFGDNLMSYYHAKWISYKFGIPLLYRPFIHSEDLMLSVFEQPYASIPGYYHDNRVKLVDPVLAFKGKEKPVLFFVPYFPESEWEKENCISFAGGKWEHFLIDWKDKGFIEELRKVIQPKSPLSAWPLPEGRISVALHLRKGGYHDTPETLPGFPLKFLPDDFYIEQLRALHAIVGKRPLYVFLFTDDPHPMQLKEQFEKQFLYEDIVFDCRKTENHDRIHVIEDFFAFSYFDCIIHSESNYPLCISKITDYLVQIYPYAFHKENGKVVIDGIHVNVNQAMLEELP